MMVLSLCLKLTMVAILTIPLEKSLMQIVPLVLPILRNKILRFNRRFRFYKDLKFYLLSS